VVQYHRNNKFLKLIGERVREARKKLKLTQADVAFELNVPISQIGRIERGEANFSVSYLPDIAKVLKVKPSELLES
jgi:transcriptional regulator with XRE-family HTH domain